MNQDNRFPASETRRSKGVSRIPVPRAARASQRDLDRAAHARSADIAAIACAEGWLTPLMPIERVALRPWQQTVFWGLRLYIGVMLIVMGWGFLHVAGG